MSSKENEFDGQGVCDIVNRLLPQVKATWEYPGFIHCIIGEDCCVAFGDANDRWGMSIHDPYQEICWGGIDSDLDSDVIITAAVAGVLLELLTNPNSILEVLKKALVDVQRDMERVISLKAEEEFNTLEGQLVKTIDFINQGGLKNAKS